MNWKQKIDPQGADILRKNAINSTVICKYDWWEMSPLRPGRSTQLP